MSPPPVGGESSATGTGDRFSYYDPGMLGVDTSPAVPSQISVDGNIAETWSTTRVKVVPGTHEVCFGDVAGSVRPGRQTVTVASGQATTVRGDLTSDPAAAAGRRWAA